MGRDTYKRYITNIYLIYKNKEDLKAYLEIFLSIIAMAAFILLAIKPTIITITGLVTKINTQQDISDKLDQKIKNLGIAQTFYNRQENQIQLLNSAIPNIPAVQDYTRQIEGLIKKNNINIVSISSDKVLLLPIPNSLENNSMTMTIAVSGAYSDLQNFVKSIENLRRPAQFSKVDLGISQSTLNLALTLKIPFQ